MSKRLIAITNDGSLGAGWGGNYHAWMERINATLAKGRARVVNIIQTGDDFQGATAFIEIDESPIIAPLGGGV